MDDPTRWTRNDTPKTFYSPLHKEIKVPYRDDDNKEHFYTIEPLSVNTHPTYMADIFIENVLEAYINELGLGFQTPEERNELRKEIYG